MTDDVDLEAEDIRKFVQVTMERMARYFHGHDVPAASMLAAAESLMLRTLAVTVKKHHWDEAIETHCQHMRNGVVTLREGQP
jgi:hypothetical protein